MRDISPDGGAFEGSGGAKALGTAALGSFLIPVVSGFTAAGGATAPESASLAGSAEGAGASLCAAFLVVALRRVVASVAASPGAAFLVVASLGATFFC